MDINSNTKLSDILAAYPWLPDELVKIDGRFKIIKTPIGKMMIKNATVKDAVAKIGLPEETILQQLRQMIQAHS
ncbi:MAG: hypothetical protein IJ598_02660 [Ruminococcus sp.]|nr:hypothetical protein [Ruminococcus sp.]